MKFITISTTLMALVLSAAALPNASPNNGGNPGRSDVSVPRQRGGGRCSAWNSDQGNRDGDKDGSRKMAKRQDSKCDLLRMPRFFYLIDKLRLTHIKLKSMTLLGHSIAEVNFLILGAISFETFELILAVSALLEETQERNEGTLGACFDLYRPLHST